MIIWYPAALARLVSMDETDVRTDQTKRGHSAAARSVRTQAPGSRRGHSKGEAGRKPTSGGITKKSKPHRGGFADNKRVGGKRGPRPGETDQGDALVTKSASKISFAGGTRGDSKSLSPLVMSDHPLSPEELDCAPVGTARNAQTGELVPAAFNINKSGGMESADMLIWIDRIAVPSTGTTATNRGMACLDGLGQHHSFPVVQKLITSGFDLALRFPHGSSRGQHEDFEHFSYFKPAHEAAKIKAQVAQFEEARSHAAEQRREPTRAELMSAAVLTDAASLRAAREPWHEAFSETRVKRGWAEEGVVPFTRKLYWDLKKEEEAKGITVSNVPPANLSDFGVPAPPAQSSSTAMVAAPCAQAGPVWDDGIDEEVERLLQQELGDSTLQVAPVPPPKRLPKLTSALLFKVPGGATGELGKQLVRAKEVERRLTIARSQAAKDKREARDKTKSDADWSIAAGALTMVEASNFDIKVLNKPQLQSLVRVLKAGNATGKKDALAGLLVERFGTLSREQFDAIKTTVNRGIAVAELPAPKEVLALPENGPEPEATLPGPSTAGEQPLALRRPRRGE